MRVLCLSHFPLSFHHLHYLLLNRFQRLGCDNGAGSAFAFQTSSTAEGTEPTRLKHSCPKEKLFVLILGSKKFR